MDSKKKITNNKQLEMLVEAMKKERNIACGFTKDPKEKVKEFWKALTVELNTEGPPLRETAEWKKVWTDYKAFVKRKLVNNKKNITATGGGPSREIPLSGIEEEVAALLQLDVAVEGIEGVRSYGVMTASTDPSTSEAVSLNMEEIPASPLNDCKSDIRAGCVELGTPANAKKRRRGEDDSTLELLKEQINIQRNLAKCLENGVNVNSEGMKELISEMKKSRKISEKMYDMTKKSVKLQEEIVHLKKRN